MSQIANGVEIVEVPISSSMIPYLAKLPKERKVKQGPGVGKTVYTGEDSYYDRKKGKPPVILAWKIVRDQPTYVDVESLDPRYPYWKRSQRFMKNDRGMRLFDAPEDVYAQALKWANDEVVTQYKNLDNARANLRQALDGRRALKAAIKGLTK